MAHVSIIVFGAPGYVKKVYKTSYAKNSSLYSLKTVLISPPNTKNHKDYDSIIVFGAPGSVKETSSKIIAHSAIHS